MPVELVPLLHAALAGGVEVLPNAADDWIGVLLIYAVFSRAPEVCKCALCRLWFCREMTTGYVARLISCCERAKKKGPAFLQGLDFIC